MKRLERLALAMDEVAIGPPGGGAAEGGSPTGKGSPPAKGGKGAPAAAAAAGGDAAAGARPFPSGSVPLEAGAFDAAALGFAPEAAERLAGRVPAAMDKTAAGPESVTCVDTPLARAVVRAYRAALAGAGRHLSASLASSVRQFSIAHESQALWSRTWAALLQQLDEM